VERRGGFFFVDYVNDSLHGRLALCKTYIEQQMAGTCRYRLTAMLHSGYQLMTPTTAQAFFYIFADCESIVYS
jgi:hypothetical protein